MGLGLGFRYSCSSTAEPSSPLQYGLGLRVKAVGLGEEEEEEEEEESLFKAVVGGGGGFMDCQQGMTECR